MTPDLMKALDARDDRVKEQLDQIGRAIGYGRSIQLLGQLWDDMMQASYPQVGRHQEGAHRRSDIERIEAGMPIGRKLVYVPKRGRKGVFQVTTWSDHDSEIPNVGRIISDTPLYGRIPYADDKAPAQVGAAGQSGRECWNCAEVSAPCYDGGTAWCVKCGVVDNPSDRPEITGKARGDQ